MPDACIILISGYPGVGKGAVAQDLAKLLPNARVLDMHQLDIAASSLHQTHSMADNLRYKLRETVLSSLFATPTSPSPTCPTKSSPPLYILTDTIYTSPPTKSYQDLYLAQAKDHHLPLLHLILSCSTEANIARFTHGSRNGWKDHDETHVVENRMTYEVAHFVKPGRLGRGPAAIEGLAGEYEVDSTTLSSGQTAGVLAEYVQDSLRNEGWFFMLNRVKAVRPAGAVNGGGAGHVNGNGNGSVLPPQWA